MAAPATVVWNLDPHTQAKHVILRKYLDQWLPILSHGGFPKVVFIDGFAGPGIYEDGSDGSPTIALKAFLEHSSPITTQVHFHFIEQDTHRAEILKREIVRLFEKHARPSNLHCSVHSGESFEDAYGKIVGCKETVGAPILALIDPFGWTGAPMSIIADILGRQSSEILMNFMFEEINRFLAHEAQPDNFDALFGAPGWREFRERNGAPRKNGIREYYGSQLRSVGGARLIRSFEMRNKRDQTDYFLFFATNSRKGLSAMKRSMWKVDEMGTFQFSDATNPDQLVLLESGPDPRAIEQDIVRNFRGRTVPVTEVARFIIEDTAYLDSHFKKILKAMEDASPPRLEVVDAPPNRRRGTFADDVKVRFP